MHKSISYRPLPHFVTCLRQARAQARLTQQDSALRLGDSQFFVSKCAR